MKTELFLVLVALLVPWEGVFLPASRATETTPDNQRFCHRVVELVNIERAKAKLSPLKFQPDLATAANWLAQAMVDHHFFSHTDHQGRDVQTRLPDFGYKDPSSCGENIAAGMEKPEAVVSGWMHSSGHRANILNATFSEAGVGLYNCDAGLYHHYWVLDFGSRPDVYPVVINGDTSTTHSADVKLYVYGEGVIDKMRLSNDGVTWTPWKAFHAEQDWTLTAGNGKRTVYVELDDGQKIFRSDSVIEVTPKPDKPDKDDPAATDDSVLKGESSGSSN